MGISLRPERLKRYKDVALLLWRHGRSDLVKSAGLDEAMDGEGTPAETVTAEAHELAADLERMGPTFIKLGQLLSTRADILPVPYLEALTRLQDDVSPVPFPQIAATVERELGRTLADAFKSFDREPLAAASLGQVHHAVLPSGVEVAVKVQRPGAREQVIADFEALQDIAEFIDHHTEWGRKHEAQKMLDEYRRTLMNELDYRQEADNLRKLADNLASFVHIVVPPPVAAYTTARVLTMDYVRGRKISPLTMADGAGANGAMLADEIFRAYLQQILVDGFFHADPHPGNVFLTEDGRVALLDLGMVAHVSPDMQEKLLKLLLAVTEGRGEDAARIAAKIGKHHADFDETEYRRRIVELVMRNDVRLNLKGIEVGRTVLETTRISGDCGITAPRELMMLGKALLNLDHVARVLDPHFEPNVSVRKNAATIMQQRMHKSLSPGNLFSTFLELKEFAAKLPRRATQILDVIANNQLEIKVDAIDEERLISGLHKIANRITLGLILAALILAAAMLMRVQTKFVLFGYPGLAIILFIAAAGGGIALSLSIVMSDRKPDRRD